MGRWHALSLTGCFFNVSRERENEIKKNSVTIETNKKSLLGMHIVRVYVFFIIRINICLGNKIHQNIT